MRKPLFSYLQCLTPEKDICLFEVSGTVISVIIGVYHSIAAPLILFMPRILLKSSTSFRSA